LEIKSHIIVIPNKCDGIEFIDLVQLPIRITI